MQPVVVGPEHRVVEPLGVVGVRPGVEQQRGQGPGMRMRWLADDAALAFAHRAGEGREPVRAPPHEVSVRVGAVREQQPGATDGVRFGKLLGHARVAEVEQRRPLARPAGRGGAAGVLAQEPLESRHAGRRGSGMRIDRRQRRPGGEHSLGAIDPGRRIVAVGQAGQIQEPRRLALLGNHREFLDMFRQPSPARESVLAGDYELGIRQRAKRFGAGVMLLNARADAVRIGAMQPEKLLGLLLDARQARPGW